MTSLPYFRHSALYCAERSMILKPPPATDIQAENVLEVVPLLDPVLHHVLEAWPPFGRQTGLAGVHEFVDDLSTPLLSAQGRTWSC